MTGFEKGRDKIGAWFWIWFTKNKNIKKTRHDIWGQGEKEYFNLCYGVILKEQHQNEKKLEKNEIPRNCVWTLWEKRWELYN